MDNGETVNIGYTRRRQTKQEHNTICVGHHFMQTNTNNVKRHEPSYNIIQYNNESIVYLQGRYDTDT
jgi:hypothetical protein